jgi:hypothetical protein
MRLILWLADCCHKLKMHERFEYMKLRPANLLGFLALGLLLLFLSPALAQKKSMVKKPAVPDKPPTETQLAKLRDEYINATKDYKASLQKLLNLYRDNVKKVEDRQEQMQKLLAQGLVSRREVEDVEALVIEARSKVTGVEQQIAGADTQIANALIEIEGEKQLAKLGPMGKSSLVRTTSFIRFSGAGHWVLSQASPIESFFQQTFKRPLPIAVFGQGAIHNQWRLDHRNAMDISLNPDGAEGQALIRFLQSNGIPFSAFRGAIPGVATGPHIHIGLPSHRY